MAKKKAYRSPWFSEQELGDKIWEIREEVFACSLPENVYREVQIGTGRIDFVSFSEKHVDLWELKITATVDSVIQIAKYQRDFHEYMRQIFFAGNRDSRKAPNFDSHIIARYFDSKIIELCAEFNITLWRLDVDNKGNITVEADWENDFPVVPDHCEIVDLAIKHFDPEVINV